MGIFEFFRRPGANRDKIAIEIDLATGVLEECPICRGISDKLRDDRLPAADQEAHQRFDNNDPSIAVFQGDLEDLLRRLRSVRKELNYHCTCMDAG